jgi:hypothetical protein
MFSNSEPTLNIFNETKIYSSYQINVRTKMCRNKKKAIQNQKIFFNYLKKDKDILARFPNTFTRLRTNLKPALKH